MLRLSIVYDNCSLNPRLQPDWGFGCLVQGLERRILFDTGADGNILLSNLKGLNLNAQEIDMVLLSHEHRDHTGGLKRLLEVNPGLEVWVPDHFSEAFFQNLDRTGTKYRKVTGSSPLCSKAHTTGVIPGWIKEQALVLESSQGLVLVTGCAHPRLINILDHVRTTWETPVYLVLGGFHLGGFEKQDLKVIIDSLRRNRIQQVGPAHCTGEEAKEYFKQAYPEGFIEMGVGREIELP